jgi:hypothetical protein
MQANPICIKATAPTCAALALVLGAVILPTESHGVEFGCGDIAPPG